MATMCSLALGSSLATAPQSPAHLASLSSDLNGAQLMFAKHRNHNNLASFVAQSSMFDLPVVCLGLCQHFVLPILLGILPVSLLSE